MFRSSLLSKTIFAVFIGIIASKVVHFVPYYQVIIQVLDMFNTIFIEYLVFLVPIMVIALIASGILELGQDASYLLFQVVLLSVFCMLLGAVISYLLALLVLPYLASNNLTEMSFVADNSASSEPYLAPLMSVTAALVLSFSIGLAGRNKIHLKNLISDFKEVVLSILNDFIVPLIPFYVGLSFFKMTYSNLFSDNLSYFLFLSLFTLFIHWIITLIIYSIVGFFVGKSPLVMIFNMLPSYITGIGTMSSAATIPVTLTCSSKNDVKEDINDFVIPICATINLSGTAVNQVFCSLAIYYIFHDGMLPELNTIILLILNIIILLVAAPGIPGGAVVATMPVIQPVLGLSGLEVSILYAIGIANDTFATGTNVINDGAIAKFVDHMFNKSSVKQDKI